MAALVISGPAIVLGLLESLDLSRALVAALTGADLLASDGMHGSGWGRVGASALAIAQLVVPIGFIVGGRGPRWILGATAAGLALLLSAAAVGTLLGIGDVGQELSTLGAGVVETMKRRLLLSALASTSFGLAAFTSAAALALRDTRGRRASSVLAVFAWLGALLALSVSTVHHALLLKELWGVYFAGSSHEVVTYALAATRALSFVALAGLHVLSAVDDGEGARDAAR